MLKTALDLVPILEAIDVVKSSKLLTKAQQNTMLREIAYAIPAPVFCKQCPETLSIINSLVETTDGSRTERASKEETKEAKKPKPSATRPNQPDNPAAPNTRRPRKASGDAGKPKE